MWSTFRNSSNEKRQLSDLAQSLGLDHVFWALLAGTEGHRPLEWTVSLLPFVIGLKIMELLLE